MATRPPRVTSTSRQRTTRGGPVVTSRTRQPTTGQGRIVRQPANPWVSRGTLAGIHSTPGTSGGGGVPAAASGAPAAPQYNVSNLPPDASYDAAVAALQKQRDQQILALQQARSSGLLDYGFTENAGALAFDPNNPRSKAALLKKAYDTNRRSTGQSMAAGGQQYAGAYQNAQDLVNRNQLGAEDTLQKSLINFLARNTQQVGQAGTNYELGVGQAAGDRVGRFQSNPLYDPASAASSASGGTGGGSAGTPAAASAAGGVSASAVAAMRRRQRLTGARIGRI